MIGVSTQALGCPKCRTEVRQWERYCPACQRDCDPPNVRCAKRGEEIAALELRFRKAARRATTKGYLPVLERFHEAASKSRAVLCRSVNHVFDLVGNENALYASFYQLVGMGARRADETQIEHHRALADDWLFPYFKESIRFAALSIDGTGVSDYGNCSVVLNNLHIEDRATVFEENSVTFFQRFFSVKNAVPRGYRATWADRGKLAVAKLYARLAHAPPPDDFGSVLLSAAPLAGAPDFIEVHIFGPLHRRSIEQVIVTNPAKHQRGIVRELTRVLASIGVDVQVR